MTEKQFFITNGKHMVLEYEFYNGKNRLSPSEVIDLLNAQHEEITRLRKEIKALNDFIVLEPIGDEE